MIAHGPPTFQAVFENDSPTHPLFEHLNDHRTLHWQKGPISISSILAMGGMNAVCWAFFGPMWERSYMYAQNLTRTVSDSVAKQTIYPVQLWVLPEEYENGCCARPILYHMGDHNAEKGIILVVQAQE